MFLQPAGFTVEIEPAEKILIEAGSWYRKVREGLTATPAPDLSTSRQPVTGEPGGDTFYWILEEPSASSRFVLPGKQFPDIAEAELLNTGEKLPTASRRIFPEFFTEPYRTVFDVPVDAGEIRVLKLRFRTPVFRQEAPEKPVL